MLKKIKTVIWNLIVRYSVLMWVYNLMRFELHVKENLKVQLRPLKVDELMLLPLKGKKILMPQIETSHYQYHQMFILAKALEMRGAHVKLLLCNSVLDGCEIKNVRNEMAAFRCLDCKFNQKHIVPMYGLETALLSDLISQADLKMVRKTADEIIESGRSRFEHKGIELSSIVEQSVVRYYYGGIPKEKERYIKTKREHLVSAIIGVEAAERLENTWSPDVILNNMEIYSAWEPYFRYFSLKKKDLFRVSISHFNYRTLALNPTELFVSNDRFDRYVTKRSSRSLSFDEKEELREFVKARVEGRAEIFKNTFSFESGKVKEYLNIDRNKRNIFLFSNLHWDPGLAEAGNLFGDVIEFVLRTIELVSDMDNVHLYVKTHPYEKFLSSGSIKTVSDYVNEKFHRLPDNVSLVLPDYKVSTYELFPFIDLGAVFGSTTGLEMLLYDIPIVVTGKAPYARHDIAYEPRSMEEYRKILKGEVEKKRVSMDEVELLAYFYFIKSRIPWKLTERAYADDFKGFTFNSLQDILPGNDKHLDHMCRCILDPKNTVIEAWE